MTISSRDGSESRAGASTAEIVIKDYFIAVNSIGLVEPKGGVYTNNYDLPRSSDLYPNPCPYDLAFAAAKKKIVAQKMNAFMIDNVFGLVGKLYTKSIRAFVKIMTRTRNVLYLLIYNVLNTFDLLNL